MAVDVKDLKYSISEGFEPIVEVTVSFNAEAYMDMKALEGREAADEMLGRAITSHIEMMRNTKQWQNPARRRGA